MPSAASVSNTLLKARIGKYVSNAIHRLGLVMRVAVLKGGHGLEHLTALHKVFAEATVFHTYRTHITYSWDFVLLDVGWEVSLQ